MNTEDFKSIVEVIKTLSSDGLTGFIWYVIGQHATSIINSAILGGSLYAIIRLVTATVIKVKKPEHPELSRAQAAYEAVRAAWLYGKRPSHESNELYLMTEKLEKYAKKD